MLRRLTDQSDNGSQTIDVIFILSQILGRYGRTLGILQLQHSLFIEPTIVHDALVNGELVFRFTLMESIHMLHQFLSLFIKLTSQNEMIVRHALLIQILQDGGKLLNQVALGRLVGMEFQTKVTQSKFLQTVLNYGKSSHLFGHKQHPFAMIKRIRNHVRNGLRLSRSRRSMKNKALPLGRFHDGRQLRRIERQWCTHIARFDSLIQV